MAFSYKDSTGKSVFDIAESNVIFRGSDGSIKQLVVDGVINVPAIPAPYTDANARNAIKTKTQVAALTSASTLADIVAALQA